MTVPKNYAYHHVAPRLGNQMRAPSTPCDTHNAGKTHPTAKLSDACINHAIPTAKAARIGTPVAVRPRCTPPNILAMVPMHLHLLE